MKIKQKLTKIYNYKYMRLESILQYYQDEMEFLVNSGKNFAKKYPDLAKTLDFSSFSSNDPDVQRLIESVALLNARLQKRLDEQAPEISNAILNAIYPQFSEPIPSLMIVNFSHLNKIPNQENKFIPKNTTLTSAKSYEGTYYSFKTTMDTQITNYEITQISLKKTAAANLPYSIYTICDNALEFGLENMNPKAEVKSLVFYIHMIDQMSTQVYEAIMTLFPNRNSPVFEDGEEIGEIEPVGFEENESLFPIGPRENGSYRLLLEYNVFAKKFLFFRVKFTKPPKKSLVIPFNSKKDIFIKLGDILLNCTPVINLFEKNSEPITLNQKTTNYPILADNNAKSQLGIHSVLSIEDTAFEKNRRYLPYFGAQHINDQDLHNIFWLTKREMGKNYDSEYDISVSFLDTEPDLTKRVLFAKLLCLQFNANINVETEDSWNIANNPGNLRCINLDRPTPSVIPPMNSRTQWRLISHLSVNHFGFENDEGLELLKELLTIYNFVNSGNKNSIHDLKKMDYQTKMTAFEGKLLPVSEITMICDDSTSSNEVFLLAEILGHFFAKNLNFNTKIEFVAKKQNSGKIWKKWKIK